MKDFNFTSRFAFVAFYVDVQVVLRFF